jgi:hypothetical protein
LNLIKTPNNENYLLMIHPFPKYFYRIIEKIGMVDPEYFDSFQFESVEQMIYKIYKIRNEYKRITVTTRIFLIKSNYKLLFISSEFSQRSRQQ